MYFGIVSRLGYGIRVVVSWAELLKRVTIASDKKNDLVVPFLWSFSNRIDMT